MNRRDGLFQSATLSARPDAGGRFAEAEQIYREDLVRLPEWVGAFRPCAEPANQAKKTMSRRGRRSVQKVWAKTDLKLTSSCLCQPGTHEDLKVGYFPSMIRCKFG